MVMANFETFSEVIRIKNSAYEELKSTTPDPPKVLLLGKIMKGHLDAKNHHVEMSANFLVVTVAMKL